MYVCMYVSNKKNQNQITLFQTTWSVYKKQQNLVYNLTYLICKEYKRLTKVLINQSINQKFLLKSCNQHINIK